MRKFIATTAILIASLALPAAAQTAHADHAAAAAEVQARHLSKIQQVADASWPLLVHGADMCELDTAFRTGLRYSVIDERMPDSGARVIAVPSGSPADIAGVQQGDKLITVNGRKVEKRNPTATTENLDELFNDAAESDAAIAITVERAGTTLDLTLKPVNVCDLKVEYVPVAFQMPSSGGYVAVSELFFLVAQEDWQRRAFLAPDMAYAMNPAQKTNSLKKKMLGAGGNVLSALAGVNGIGALAHIGGNLAMNKGQALQADRISLFLLARAGDDIEQVASFWSAVYAYPESANWKSTYFGLRPTLEERATAFRQAIAEIKALNDAGKPLLPTQQELQS